MLCNTIKLCLFCDAGLAHNPIFNYYLLPLKKKKKEEKGYYVIMPVGQRPSGSRGLYTLMEAVNLKSFFSFNELDCLKYLTGKRLETIKPHRG